jgi:hypothetical protein
MYKVHKAETSELYLHHVIVWNLCLEVTHMEIFLYLSNAKNL